MKTKIILTAFITVLIATTTFSQLGVKGGFNLANQVNGAQGLYLGFDLGVTYDITDNIRGEVLFEGLFKNEDYNVFGGYNYIVNYRILPITIGIDYRFLTGKVQPYAGLNLGIMSFASRLNKGSYNGNSYFTLHPKAGVNIEITDNILIDVALKYHIAFTGSNLNNNKSTQLIGANIGLIYVF